MDGEARNFEHHLDDALDYIGDITLSGADDNLILALSPISSDLMLGFEISSPP